MTSAADLLALQDIDLKRDARRAILADIESRLNEPEALSEAREMVDDDQEILRQSRREQQNFEEKLQDLDAKIVPLETRLYDGSVRNPKELADMQKELESFKAHRGKLDEQGLKLLEQVESATRNFEASQQVLATEEASWKKERATLVKDRSKAQKDTAVLDKERARWTESMDRLAIGLYDKLRPAHQGRAVARVERGICQGCRVTLPTHLVQKVRAGTDLIQCPRCERILVGA